MTGSPSAVFSGCCNVRMNRTVHAARGKQREADAYAQLYGAASPGSTAWCPPGAAHPGATCSRGAFSFQRGKSRGEAHLGDV